VTEITRSCQLAVLGLLNTRSQHAPNSFVPLYFIHLCTYIIVIKMFP
jgi:hypothetical protein